MKFNSILALVVTLYSVSINAQSVITEKSYVNFEISNMAVNTVEGSFTGMTGNITFSNQTISNINICIDPATVNTDNEKRDAHLLNEDFFEVKKYKTICFQSSTIIKSENGYITNGKLTMHGITKEVSIPLKMANNTLTGEFVIDRFDYGVGDEGSFSVGREVKMTIQCQINKAQS